MTEEIQALYEETEKLGSRILDECQSFLVEDRDWETNVLVV